MFIKRGSRKERLGGEPGVDVLAGWIAESAFNEIAALLVLAAGIGLIGMLLRQPLIVSFIAVGILAGPSALDITRSPEQISLLAELGIAVLLFLVGIKLDLKLIKTLGPLSLATGLGQVGFTSLFGYLICKALGLDDVTSLYVAVALTFSSTIIIVKLLSDKKEIDALHGRIALGFLIVQDIVVVLAMIALSAIGVGTTEGAGTADIVRVFGAGAGMLVLVLLFIRFLADPLSARLAHAPELLSGFAIALAALFAAIGSAMGFGKELGGLLAGVALASTPFRDAIAARLSPLRDFLLLFFFISLGSGLDLGALGSGWLEAAVLSLFVLVGNPLIVLVIVRRFGHANRTGFLAGLTVAQISEFSLVFMAMGVALGHVTTEALGLVTLVGLVTIAASTYMITYSHQLYAFCEPLLARLFPDRKGGSASHPDGPENEYDAIVLGLGRYGGTIARRLADEGLSVLGVDFNPEVVKDRGAHGLPALYGDVSDGDFLSGLPLRSAKWVISAIPDPNFGVSRHDSRAALIRFVREAGFTGSIAVSTHEPGLGPALRSAGADFVLEPHTDAAERAADLVIGEHRGAGAVAG